MHSALLPAFIAAFDWSSAAVASFCLAGSVILAIIPSICFICSSLHRSWAKAGLNAMARNAATRGVFDMSLLRVGGWPQRNNALIAHLDDSGLNKPGATRSRHALFSAYIY